MLNWKLQLLHFVLNNYFVGQFEIKCAFIVLFFTEIDTIFKI